MRNSKTDRARIENLLPLYRPKSAGQWQLAKNLMLGASVCFAGEKKTDEIIVF